MTIGICLNYNPSDFQENSIHGKAFVKELLLFVSRTRFWNISTMLAVHVD